MEAEEIKYWLWWNRVPGVGPARFYKLFETFGTMEAAWKASLMELKPILGEKVLAAMQETKKEWDPELELAKIDRYQYRIYCHSEPDYPAALKKISDPPPVLYARGWFEYGDDVAVAIVGTRNPTPLGGHTARELAGNLSRQGLTIVSGLARGIDSEGHRGALDAGGRTVAVLGSGIDVPYPPENEPLLEEIAAHGAVVSEFPLGTEPYAKNFPARNRIISGLSQGVIVVEAAQDSGSLITAGFALEQGREVFAVPGNIANESSKGPHKLIKQGAKLIESYLDVLSELAIPYIAASDTNSIPTGPLGDIEKQVMAVMTREPLHIDQILRRSALASAQVSSALVQLELKGLIKRFPGQLYVRLR
jgi:DNA processing protein